MRPPAFAASAAVLVLAGCGYIGSTQPPLANIPAEPTGLTVVQRGASIYAHFKVPELTTEARPIKGALELDLRAGVTPSPWNLSQWLETAHKFTPEALHSGVAEYRFPSLGWTGKEITVAAQVTGENGKSSGWSALATVPVVAPLAPPQDLTVQPAPNGVHLTWRGPGKQFRILRRAGAPMEFSQVGTSATDEFLDSTAELGNRYSYEVQTIEDLGDHREAQSDVSAERAIDYKDIFPPAVPTGLRATTSPNSIELSWDAGSDADLAGYRVYRSINGGALEKIADVGEIPAYSDKAVEPGKTYRYAVTAVDKSGNESGKSSTAEAAL